MFNIEIKYLANIGSSKNKIQFKLKREKKFKMHMKLIAL